jgi:hypothetical protein
MAYPFQLYLESNSNEDFLNRAQYQLVSWIDANLDEVLAPFRDEFKNASNPCPQCMSVPCDEWSNAASACAIAIYKAPFVGMYKMVGFMEWILLSARDSFLDAYDFVFGPRIHYF